MVRSFSVPGSLSSYGARCEDKRINVTAYWHIRTSVHSSYVVNLPFGADVA